MDYCAKYKKIKERYLKLKKNIYDGGGETHYEDQYDKKGRWTGSYKCAGLSVRDCEADDRCKLTKNGQCRKAQSHSGKRARKNWGKLRKDAHTGKIGSSTAFQSRAFGEDEEEEEEEEEDHYHIDNLAVPISKLNINQNICLFDMRNDQILNEHKCYDITEHFNHILDDSVWIMTETYDGMLDDSMLDKYNNYDYNKITRERDFKYLYEDETSDDNIERLNSYLEIFKKKVIESFNLGLK